MRALALGVIAVCRILAQDVQVEFYPSVDFSKFTTFSIGESQLDSKNPSLNNDKIKLRLNLLIQKSFEEKGLKFAQEDASSLKVVYLLDSAKKMRIEGGNGPKTNNQVTKLYTPKEH